MLYKEINNVRNAENNVKTHKETCQNCQKGSHKCLKQYQGAKNYGETNNGVTTECLCLNCRR